MADLNGATSATAKTQKGSTALTLRAAALNVPNAFTRHLLAVPEHRHQGWLNPTHSWTPETRLTSSTWTTGSRSLHCTSVPGNAWALLRAALVGTWHSYSSMLTISTPALHSLALQTQLGRFHGRAETSECRPTFRKSMNHHLEVSVSPRCRGNLCNHFQLTAFFFPELKRQNETHF